MLPRYIIVQQLQWCAGIAIFVVNFVLVDILRWITTKLERHSCRELQVASFTSKVGIHCCTKLLHEAAA
jgi:hypothetical protein